MKLSWQQFVDANGNVEATGSRYSDGMELREGYLLVTYPSGEQKIFLIDDLPDHWICQLSRWTDFGKTL
jgi:hypothetical protein